MRSSRIRFRNRMVFDGLILISLLFSQNGHAQVPGDWGTFKVTGSMTEARSRHTATKLPDGRVLVTGGSRPDGEYLRSAEIYDPATGTFTPTGSMNRTRTLHTATLLSDGTVLITGGWERNVIP